MGKKSPTIAHFVFVNSISWVSAQDALDWWDCMIPVRLIYDE